MPDDNALQLEGKLPDDPEAGTVELPSPLDQLAPRVGTFYDRAVARMKDREQGRELPIVLPWPTVNKLLGGGLWPGLHILVGNPGAGKSQLALQAAYQAAKDGVPVLYVGLELNELDLTSRLLGLVTHRHWSRYYLGQETPPPDARAQIMGLPLRLDLRGPHRWTPDDLDESAQALTKESGGKPFLVVLDFLQIVGDGGAQGMPRDLRQRIGEAAYRGSSVARKYGAAVLMLSSTARENAHLLQGKERTGKGGPQPAKEPLGKGWAGRFQALGKESGEIEYAADTVFVLCRDSQEAEKPGPWPHWLALAKIRAGREGWAELRFDGNCFAESVRERVSV